MNKTISSVSALLLFVVGCTQVDPEIQAKADQIRTATPYQVTNCQFLGQVRTVGVPIEGGMSAAMAYARQDVAKKGGNTMVIVLAYTTPSGQFISGNVDAEAYRC